MTRPPKQSTFSVPVEMGERLRQIAAAKQCDSVFDLLSAYVREEIEAGTIPRGILDDAERSAASGAVSTAGTVRCLDSTPRAQVDHRPASPSGRGSPISTGLPCSCQASMPPRTQIPSYPTWARYCSTRIDRPLEWQTTYRS